MFFMQFSKVYDSIISEYYQIFLDMSGTFSNNSIHVLVLERYEKDENEDDK